MGLEVDTTGTNYSNAVSMDAKHSQSRTTSDELRATRYENISIIGDGGMATAMAIMLLEKYEIRNLSDDSQDSKYETPPNVRMWGYDRKQLLETEKSGENKKFLPGYRLPKSLVFEPDDKRIMAGADLIISAVPCQFMRSVWMRLKDYTPKGVPVVSVAKGIENDTLLRPTQILVEVLEDRSQGSGVRRQETGARNQKVELKTQNAFSPHPAKTDSKLKTAVLSGPTIADELARKLPAVACAAAENEQFAKTIQQTFSCSWLRVYTNTDVVGVELAGAMKNVIAIAAGIIDGAGMGDNAKAALLSRGLAEITRLGVAMGARPATFGGLTGLGDLVTTCISPKGRNRSFGERVGKGQTTAQAENATESVVEGVATCKSVVALAAKYGVEMPITQAVYEVLFENKPVRTAIRDLMTRQLKAE
jgi:glycerol-3-phosphate dehydrogenase (NAD(P)+)